MSLRQVLDLFNLDSLGLNDNLKTENRFADYAPKTEFNKTYTASFLECEAIRKKFHISVYEIHQIVNHLKCFQVDHSNHVRYFHILSSPGIS